MNAPIDREQWLRRRKLGIGGSDAAALFNEEYGCQRALWFDKRDVPADFPQEETGPMLLGTALESLVCDLYAARTGRALRVSEAVAHPDQPWMRCNVDRLIEPVADRDGVGVLEVKTAGGFLFRGLRQAGLRTSYILQLNHNMYVTGLRWGAFAVMSRDTGELVYFDVERDDALCATIAEAGERVWRMVQHGPMPEPLPEIDRRCKTCPWRRQCRGEALLAAAGPLGREDAGATLDADEGLAPLLVDYREAERMADAANETLDLVKQSIRTYLADRTGAICSEGKVIFRSQIAQRVDAALLKARHPDIYQQVLKPSASRPLRVFVA